MLDHITIVIPTHHREEPLTRCLESLVAQTYPKDRFRVIVVPTENDIGFEVVKQFTDQLNIEAHAVPDDAWNGRSPALKRNYGVELADTEWVGFIDDDCVAAPKWIESARALFSDELGGIEGHTVIPPIAPPTLTYKGIQRLSTPEGYQTCNMFYKKEVFLKAGGFDLNFPFYLEDTDLAWSVIEGGSKIAFGEAVQVSHPVPPPQPWRLLDGAKRVILMPYLYRKHPKTYTDSNFVILRKSYLIYLLLWAVLISSFATGQQSIAFAAVAVLFATVIANSIKLFWGCKVTLHEYLVTTVLLPIIPVITFVQLIRGNFRQKTLLFGLRF